jgi:arginine metabolism regulation protein II
MVVNLPLDLGSFDIENNTSMDATDPVNSLLLSHEPVDFSQPPIDSISDLGSLFESSNELIWSDLFDTTFDMSTPMIHDHLHGGSYSDPLNLPAHVAHQPQSQESGTQSLHDPLNSSQFYRKQHSNAMNMLFDSQPPPYEPIELDETHVLQDAQYLLRHFRNNVVPQFGPLPMNCKSPWETLNWNNAILTLAELTWLRGPNVKHANQANLFALLGCSAHMIAKASPASTEMDPSRGALILGCASKHAKRHMQESLRLETSGEAKAKYKDQLMAIFSLIALSVSQSE